MSLSVVIFITSFVIIIIGTPFFIHWADRRRIARIITSQGGTILKMERAFLISSLLSKGNSTSWRVKYVAEDGTIHIAEGFATSMTCNLTNDQIVCD